MSGQGSDLDLVNLETHMPFTQRRLSGFRTSHTLILSTNSNVSIGISHLRYSRSKLSGPSLRIDRRTGRLLAQERPKLALLGSSNNTSPLEDAKYADRGLDRPSPCS